MNKDKINDNYNSVIQWFPGHMAKGMKEIKESANLADLFIVVLDARCPISSYNEEFDHISPQKPRLFIITKSDLMDKTKKDKINNRFKGSRVLWLDLRKKSSKQVILNAVKSIMKDKIAKDKAKGLLKSRLKSFVVGIPNCGKSTLINLVSSKASLKVANYPGVTRTKQWVVNGEFLFMDTPGILLPKFEDQEAAIKLITIGSIKVENFFLETLAFQIYGLISKYYPDKIQILGLIPCFENAQIYGQLVEYAFKQSLLITKGQPDLNKAYTQFINWARNLIGVTYD
ncbi:MULTISPECIES: ribosome biogenesis GTPase YlqF [unclassified Mycoplasma]|uniref:ribosome biogenesis GTPase YlqF n=1 Tax=unclassified Mycoplasma TaxID=2683645 RepID=UPI00211CC8BD|nr:MULTISPECIES: ribosome biogenesis GTPase YlqF [unclassified Mycoplasma]UUM19827.1 ribosome biogenesis GTPase YlqF [Mycoplasma sp. 1578d]UUM24811.1 ribosome biogenesis GTPase YlqF [Mycoplasma sp. 3686d]